MNSAVSRKPAAAVVANPPFSLEKWGIEEAAADPFHRYHRGLPPKSKGDYAFITHPGKLKKSNRSTKDTFHRTRFATAGISGKWVVLDPTGRTLV